MSGAIKAGQAYIELFAEDSKLRRGLKGGEKMLTDWGAKVATLGTSLAGAFGGILTPISHVLGSLTAGLPNLTIGDAVASFTEHGSRLDDMSQRTGASVEALSELDYAAKMSGTSLENLEKGMAKTAKVVADAADGSKTAAEALGKIGLSANKLQGISPDEQFQMIADGLAAIEDPGARAAAAIDIFGKSGTDLLPLLNGGAAGLRGMREEARRLGLVMSTEDAAAAAELGDSWDTLLSVIGKLTDNIGAALAPTLTEIVSAGVEVVATIADWIDENRGLILTVAGIAAGLAAAGVAIVGVGGTLTALGAVAGATSAILATIPPILAAIGAVGAAIASPVGLIAVGVIAAAGAILYFSGAGETALNDLGAAFGTLYDDASTMLGGIADALKGGNIGLAAEILWATLQLQWARGTAAVTEIWNGFAAILYDNFAAAMNGIQEVFINGMAAVMTALSGTIQNALELLDSLLEKLSSIPGVGTLRMAVGATSMALSPEAIEANRAAQVKGLRDSAAKAQDEREAARLKAQADAIENVQKAEDELRRKREEAAKVAEDAAHKRTKNLTAGSQAGEDQSAEVGRFAAGTFNGNVANLLGGGNTMGRVATATEQTAKNTQKTNEEVARLHESLTVA